MALPAAARGLFGLLFGIKAAVDAYVHHLRLGKALISSAQCEGSICAAPRPVRRECSERAKLRACLLCCSALTPGVRMQGSAGSGPACSG